MTMIQQDASAGAPPELEEAIGRIAKPYLEPRRHAVVAIGILRGDEKQVFGFGDLSPYGGAGYGELIYEIGSITKVFTTTLLAGLLAEGKVRLDDPVGRYEPALPADHPVELRHLATHTSGLPTASLAKRLFNRFDRKTYRDPFCLFSVEEALAYLRRKGPEQAGKKFRYSNAGMGLLGRIAARQLGTDYEGAVRERIAGPFGMMDTGIALASEQRGRAVPGYSGLLGNETRQPDLVMKDFEGAGALRSTVNDLFRFLSVHMAASRDPANPLALSHRVHHEINDKAGVGLGWIVHRTGKFVWHNGGTHGFSSFMAFRQDRPHGVVVLSNYRPGVGKVTPDSIGVELLKLP